MKNLSNNVLMIMESRTDLLHCEMTSLSMCSYQISLFFTSYGVLAFLFWTKKKNAGLLIYWREFLKSNFFNNPWMFQMILPLG